MEEGNVRNVIVCVCVCVCVKRAETRQQERFNLYRLAGRWRNSRQRNLPALSK